MSHLHNYFLISPDALVYSPLPSPTIHLSLSSSSTSGYSTLTKSLKDAPKWRLHPTNHPCTRHQPHRLPPTHLNSGLWICCILSATSASKRKMAQSPSTSAKPSFCPVSDHLCSSKFKFSLVLLHFARFLDASARSIAPRRAAQCPKRYSKIFQTTGANLTYVSENIAFLIRHNQSSYGKTIEPNDVSMASCNWPMTNSDTHAAGIGVFVNGNGFTHTTVRVKVQPGENAIEVLSMEVGRLLQNFFPGL